MANLAEYEHFDQNVYRIELQDYIVGGPLEIHNKPLKQLTNRTRWLYEEILDLKEKSEEYVLPIASRSHLGGIQIGKGVVVNDSKLELKIGFGLRFDDDGVLQLSCPSPCPEVSVAPTTTTAAPTTTTTTATPITLPPTTTTTAAPTTTTTTTAPTTTAGCPSGSDWVADPFTPITLTYTSGSTIDSDWIQLSGFTPSSCFGLHTFNVTSGTTLNGMIYNAPTGDILDVGNISHLSMPSTGLRIRSDSNGVVWLKYSVSSVIKPSGSTIELQAMFTLSGASPGVEGTETRTLFYVQ
jgi:hypothetical protein